MLNFNSFNISKTWSEEMEEKEITQILGMAGGGEEIQHWIIVTFLELSMIFNEKYLVKLALFCCLI
jgi:hypothetical protein